MKQNWILGLLIIGFFITSCSNDFELTKDWKDIPIVYGLLNKNDTAHYIRVEKAFLDPQEDAFVLAQEIDSLYYQNVTVQLERISTGQVFDLTRVDGNLEGYVRDEGVFASAPNYLYKIDAAAISLKGGESVRFLLDRGANLDLVTAETIVLEDMELRDPFRVTNMDPRISFREGIKTRIRLNVPDEAALFTFILHLNISQFDVNDPMGTMETIQLPWTIAANLSREDEGDTQITAELDGKDFFIFLQSNLDAIPTMRRIFESIDIEVVSGGQEMAQFIELKKANTGITSSQEIPTYTNLSEGRGIFSSRNTFKFIDANLASGPTRDSLKDGFQTRLLNFSF